ncbi:sugar ABC transporter permease [Natronosporangium hydrolyticum]|uniref:Sugar ABC transporter permease n=1 Tax=Natronosporangium hydrolyticum TaxID=2811111 RepID=A0A895Y5E5_9ACTN|nr:sugar ABC transporter permease [Natronosporangium hydrolyticum]QSB12907.1 sugar ABC transporter permease [Natronosporangium hydrolyticum]
MTIFLFLLPGLALFGLLVVVPVVSAGYFSLFQWNGLGGFPPNSPTSGFVGLDNYTRALTDSTFQGDLRRGGILLVLSLTIQLPLALALALLLHQKFPGRTVFRLLFFAPFVISEVITGVLFTALLRQDYGLVNELLRVFGLSALIPDNGWLGTRSILLYVAFFVITWKYFGFHMIIYMAGRQNIPQELIEAAVTDGATPWQVFRHVTLPLLGPTIRVTVFLSVIGVIQLFDMIFVLTGPNFGGPGNAASTMAITMYRHGFQRFEVGYASAISVLMFLICLIFALGYIRFVMRRDIQGAVTTAGGR